MSFFDLFRRRKAPTLSDILRDSPETWMPGDIAVCTNEAWFHFDGSSGYGPVDGQSLPVLAVMLIGGVQFLVFEQFSPKNYHAGCFVKLRPDERKACTPEFKRRLKRLRPKVTA